jgi:hypothetical protein
MRRSKGSESTHWRTRTPAGKTRSARCLACLVMRRPQQRGQKALPLQLNAVSRSRPHFSQEKRAQPALSTPHVTYFSSSFFTNLGRGLPASSRSERNVARCVRSTSCKAPRVGSRGLWSSRGGRSGTPAPRASEGPEACPRGSGRLRRRSGGNGGHPPAAAAGSPRVEPAPGHGGEPARLRGRSGRDPDPRAPRPPRRARRRRGRKPDARGRPRDPPRRETGESVQSRPAHSVSDGQSVHRWAFGFIGSGGNGTGRQQWDTARWGGSRWPRSKTKHSMPGWSS